MIEPERHGRVLTDTMPTSTGCGTERRSPSSKTAYLLAEMIGDLLHDCSLEPAGPAGSRTSAAPERATDGAALSFDQRPARDRILNCRRDRTGFLRRLRGKNASQQMFDFVARIGLGEIRDVLPCLAQCPARAGGQDNSDVELALMDPLRQRATVHPARHVNVGKQCI